MGLLSRAGRFTTALVLIAAVVLAPWASNLGRAGPGGPGARAAGRGAAAATADVYASEAAMAILARGGNAVDAAVAAAATLGVTKPFWCGIGGGGFMVVYLAASHRVVTIDHDGAAPRAVTASYLLQPGGRPIRYADATTGGIAPAVPGAVAGWDEALRRYGRLSLAGVLAPAIRVATDGFPRDAEFVAITRANAARFRLSDASRRLFLTPSGAVPPVGSVFRNPDLAAAYRLIARDGPGAFYRGPIGWAVVRSVQQPPVLPGATRTVLPGVMTLADLADYQARLRPPVVSTYRGDTVYGMGLPSAGGIALALALNMLQGYDLGALPRADALHLVIEVARRVYADRRAYLGDPAYTRPPVAGLLSPAYASVRRADIGRTASPGSVAPGDPRPFQGEAAAPPAWAQAAETVGRSTTHLTVADADGDVVSYTYTLGEGGGNGFVVPGFGFLLNTDLANFVPLPGHPNAPAGGKRPLSTMTPTIVFAGGRPWLALGSPGGGTIPTTVLQVLVDVLDFGMDLPTAIAAPRFFASSSVVTSAEPAFLASSDAAALEAVGHRFTRTGPLGIGAVTGIVFGPSSSVTAAAEPVRRGGGSALVERAP